MKRALLLALLTACTQTAQTLEPAATDTPAPTRTPIPTATPVVSFPFAYGHCLSDVPGVFTPCGIGSIQVQAALCQEAATMLVNYPREYAPRFDFAEWLACMQEGKVP